MPYAALKAIAELPGITRRILVCLCDERFRHETGVEVLPFVDFVHELERTPRRRTAHSMSLNLITWTGC